LAAKYGGRYLTPILESVEGKQAAIDNANARITGLESGTLPPGPRPEMPLPRGEGGGILTRLRTQAINQNAQINEHIEATAPTQSAAKSLQNEFGTTTNQSAFQTRMQTQMETGVNAMDRTQGINMADWARDAERLTPAQRSQVDLIAAYQNELESREKLFQQAMRDKTPTNDENLRYGFNAYDSAYLRGEIAKAMADPAVANVANVIPAVNRQMLADGVRHGFTTSADEAYLNKNRPWQMPTVDPETGKIQSGLVQLDITPGKGPQTIQTGALTAKFQQYVERYRDMQFNARNRALKDNDISNQSVNPNAPRVFTPVEATFVDKAGNKVVKSTEGGSGRDITIFENGKPIKYNINNSGIYRAVTSNVAQQNLFLDGLNSMRRLAQSGATGVSGSIFAQRPFSIIQAARALFDIPFQRSPGQIGGPIEALTSRYGLPLRGDLSFIPGGIYQSAANGAAAVAKGLGDMLAMPSHPVSIGLRKVLGNQWTDGWSTLLHEQYANSVMADMRSRGYGGGSSFAYVEPQTYSFERGGKYGVRTTYANPVANLTPDLFNRIPSMAKLPGGRGALATYINLRAMARDVHDGIADGPNTFFYRLNRDFNPNMTSEDAATAARSLLGDPTMTGAHPAVKAFGRVVPFANAIIQDMDRMYQNFREAPIAFPLSMFGALTAAAAAERFTAMYWGQSHVDHMNNQSLDQQAADFRFYHSHDPNDHTIFSVSQRLRPFVPYIRELVSTATGAYQLREDEPEWDRMLGTLGDLWHHHITVNTQDAALHGLTSVADIQVPPILQFLAAVGGKKIESIPRMVLKNIESGESPFSMSQLFTDTDKPSKVPGQSTSNYVSHNDGSWLHGVLNSLNTGLATAYQQFIADPMMRMDAGASRGDAYASAMGDVVQNWKDQTPLLNWVWGNNVRAPTYNPLRESVGNAMHVIDLVGGKPDILDYGQASPGSTESIVVRGSDKPPADPTMREMWLETGEFKQVLAPYKKQLMDVEAKIKEIQSSELNAEDKRKVVNQMQAKADDAAAQVDQQIRWFESHLSRLVGGKTVNFPINWDRGPDQFH